MTHRNARSAVRWFVRPRIGALVAVAALAVPAAAAASAQPVSPTAGASVAAHPVFTWTLPAGETSEALAVASSPETTPDGDFFTENIKGFGALQETDTTWQPASPLMAGSYWWSVETFTSDPFAVLHMTPQPFTVATVMSVTKIRITRDTRRHRVLLLVEYSSNAAATSVRLQVKSGSKVIGSYTEADNQIGVVVAQWKRRNVKEGARVVFVVTLTANAATRTAVRPFRAP